MNRFALLFVVLAVPHTSLVPVVVGVAEQDCTSAAAMISMSSTLMFVELKQFLSVIGGTCERSSVKTISAHCQMHKLAVSDKRHRTSMIATYTEE